MKRLALLRIAWITLHRDRLGLLLYALVPIIFLSIFASVFRDSGETGTTKSASPCLISIRARHPRRWKRR